MAVWRFSRRFHEFHTSIQLTTYLISNMATKETQLCVDKASNVLKSYRMWGPLCYISIYHFRVTKTKWRNESFIWTRLRQLVSTLTWHLPSFWKKRLKTSRKWLIDTHCMLPYCASWLVKISRVIFWTTKPTWFARRPFFSSWIPLRSDRFSKARSRSKEKGVL